MSEPVSAVSVASVAVTMRLARNMLEPRNCHPSSTNRTSTNQISASTLSSFVYRLTIYSRREGEIGIFWPFFHPTRVRQWNIS